MVNAVAPPLPGTILLTRAPHYVGIPKFDYYFNAVRWACTGNSVTPISFKTICEGQGEYVVLRVIRVALASLPALAVDLVVMTGIKVAVLFVGKYKHHIFVSDPIDDPLPPSSEPPLNTTVQKRRENMQALQEHLPVPGVQVHVLSYLQEEERRKIFFLKADIECSAWLSQCYQNQRFCFNTWQQKRQKLERLGLTLPKMNFERIVHLKITPGELPSQEHLKADGSFLLSFRKVRQLEFAHDPKGKWRFSPQAIRMWILIYKDTLESVIYTSGNTTPNMAMSAILQCPNLRAFTTAFPLPVWHNGYPDIAASEASLLQLAKKRQLTHFKSVNDIHGICPNVFTEILANPLQALQVSIRMPPPYPSRIHEMWRDPLPNNWFSDFVIRAGQQLRILHLENFQPSDEELDLLVHHCPHLEWVDLNVTSDQEENLRPLFERSQRLRFFHFPKTWKDGQVVDLVRRCPSLERLHLCVGHVDHDSHAFTLRGIQGLVDLKRKLVLHVAHFDGDNSVDARLTRFFQNHPFIEISFTFPEPEPFYTPTYTPSGHKLRF